MPKKTTLEPTEIQHVGVPKKPRQWPAFVSVVKYATIAAARNKATLAFGFIFPLVFITVFGLLGNTGVSVSLGVVDGAPANPVTEAVKNISVFKITKGSSADLKQRLRIGKLDGVLDVSTKPNGAGYAISLFTSSANPQISGTAVSIISGVVDQANLQLAHVTEPALSFSQSQISGQEFRYIDYALPGMIGFALLGTALFGTVFGLIALKKTLVLKRMFATPTKPLTFLAGQGVSRLFFALAQTAVIVGVGVVAFHFSLPHGWLTLVDLTIISSLGLIAFLGFGYFMAGFANDENSAGPLVNLVTLPQFLLSGVFFPTDGFPAWVQPIANNLPLSYFNEAIRKVTTESGNLIDTWPYLLGLLAWGAVMYLLAAKTFRWE
jgi:ABC-2 type transport system permease protein